MKGERRAERKTRTWERCEPEPEQGVIMTCVIGSLLVLPLCFLMKPQSSITADGWLSYSQRLVVCLTITSVSVAT